MVLKAKRSCKWTVKGITYTLQSDVDIEIDKSCIEHAQASGLFYDIEIKEENAKSNKRKTTPKLTDIK